jgi:branched-chain amino acid transport system substrate-binding protein
MSAKMKLIRRLALGGVVGLAFSLAQGAKAQTPIKIGVMGDMSGFSMEIGGPGSVLAVQMAVEDHKSKAAGRPVEVLQADMQNKPDVASQLARRWFDVEKVDVITDLPNTPVALAVAQLGADFNRIVMVTEAATTDLTGAQCHPTTVHFIDDVNSLAAGTAKALVEQGLKNWFFITADYGFGAAMEAAARRVLEAKGGKTVGAVRHPFAASDFSSFLLQAQTSHADAIALANVGGDTITAIKQASEFGISGSAQQIAGLLLTISDIKALGLDVAKGLWVTESFYWDTNEKTRAFAQRFAARNSGKVPTKAHAANYAAVTHYLDAVDAAGTTEPKSVMAKMRELPIDYFGRPATQRIDGRVTYDLDLYRVKTPQESKGAYDYYQQVRTIRSDEAWLPVGAGGCALGK